MSTLLARRAFIQALAASALAAGVLPVGMPREAKPQLTQYDVAGTWTYKLTIEPDGTVLINARHAPDVTSTWKLLPGPAIKAA